MAPAAVSAKPEFKVNKVLATPAVRKMAIDYKVRYLKNIENLNFFFKYDFKINIADVPGSGKDGRVLKEDVIKFAESGGSSSVSKQTRNFLNIN